MERKRLVHDSEQSYMNASYNLDDDITDGRANRDESGKFLPGRSGNPNGRPKDLHQVTQYARQYSKEAIDRLVFWMRTDDAKASPAAANALLNRGYGMPSQVLEHSGAGGVPLAPPSLSVTFVAAAPTIDQPVQPAIETPAEPATEPVDKPE
jgi:hypothetical protein